MEKEDLNINNSFSKNDFERMSVQERIDFFAKHLKPENETDKKVALDNIYSKINNQKAVNHYFNAKFYFSIAASVLVIILFSFLYINSLTTTVIAENGKSIEHFLPDGSQVVLNSGSEIIYNKKNFSTNRILELNGEAYFSVIKGNKFVINTKQGEVEVLGTTLNVFARGKSLSVECLTGRVGVKALDANVILEPGDKAELTANNLIKYSSFGVKNMALWRIGEFHFDNKPLISIFEEIERQFDISITANGIENRFFTGIFSNKNLNEVIETVCLPMNLEYEIIKDKKVRIKPKKE